MGIFDTILSQGFAVQTKWHGAQGEDDEMMIPCMRHMMEGDFAPPGVQDGVYPGNLEVRWPLFSWPTDQKEETRRESIDARVIVEGGRIRVEHDGLPDWYQELEARERLPSQR